MYDYAHGQSDSIEKVTHSMCTLEFEDHRPLYNWFIEQLGIFPSRQIRVRPAEPDVYPAEQAQTADTCAGRPCKWLGRSADADNLGNPAARLHARSDAQFLRKCRRFEDATGSRSYALLEHFVREDLNKHAARVMAVLRPLRVVIDNYPDDLVEEMDAVNNPEDRECGNAQSSLLESALHRAGRFP